MQTRLGLFCDRLIEAGWLAALIVTPLFFSFYSFRPFELPKVGLLRSIALVMATAWVIKVVEGGSRQAGAEGGGFASSLRHLVSTNPLAIPTLILVSVQILATITSLVPHISFWGLYVRPQGTYTVLSYVVVFLLTWHCLGTRQQLERLITAILLTSLPVSLYGVVQHYGLDFLPASFWGEQRVSSTQGNPIFLGAYLVMVIPLTMGRVIETLPAIRRDLSSAMAAGCYLLLLALQSACLLFTASRGPVFGLAAGVFVFLLLLAASRGRRRLALMVAVIAIGLILPLILFNLPNTPLDFLGDVPYVGALGRVLGTSTFRGRLLIWEGVVNMVTASPWRALVGYGPDSMFLAYNPFYPLELTQYELGERPDRSHNQVFDALVTTGLVGLAAYLLLWSSIFYYGLKGSGLIRGRRERAVFISLWLTGGALGVLIPRLLEGTWRLVGIGVPLGLVAALALYLILHALFFEVDRKAGDGWRQVLLVALLSALVAHFVETQSGIAVTATLTYFWIFLALLVSAGYSLPDRISAEEARPSVEILDPRSGRRRKKKRRRAPPASPRDVLRPWEDSTILYSLLVGLILMTMGFDFINRQFNLTTDGFVAVGLIAVAWLLCGGMIVAQTGSETRFPPGSTRRVFSWPKYSLVSWGWVSLFMAPYLVALRQGTDVSNTVVIYYLFLFVGMMIIAAALIREVVLPRVVWRSTAWWLYPLLGLGALALIFVTNFQMIKADIYYKAGLVYQRSGRYDESITLYRWALEMIPDQDLYYLSIGVDSMARMEASEDPEQRSYWFDESRKAMERAMRINPLDPDHRANLGTLYLRWAGMAPSAPERTERLQKAIGYYEQARAMSPNHHGLRLKSDLLGVYILLGDVYTSLGDLDQAVTAYQAASSVDPTDYASHKGLALTYQQLGRINDALSEAEIARELAPEREKAALTELIAQLSAQQP